MKMFSYVVRRDFGFAPNPFGKHCTLATCKPEIRTAANVGDWVIGTGSADKSVGLGDNIVFAMCVEEKMRFDQYWNDTRFKYKRPLMNGSLKQTYGDNIYHLDEEGQNWIQENSHHSLEDGSQNTRNKNKDLKSQFVLISEHFWYFGRSAVPIPGNLCDSIRKKGQGHKSNCISEEVITEFVQWITDSFPLGYNGKPRQFNLFERYSGR